MKSRAETKNRGVGVPTAKSAAAKPRKVTPASVPKAVEGTERPMPSSAKTEMPKSVTSSKVTKGATKPPTAPAMPVPVPSAKPTGKRSQPKLETEIAAREARTLALKKPATKPAAVSEAPDEKPKKTPAKLDAQVSSEPVTEKALARKRKKAISLTDTLPDGTVAVTTAGKSKRTKQKIQNEPRAAKVTQPAPREAEGARPKRENPRSSRLTPRASTHTPTTNIQPANQKLRNEPKKGRTLQRVASRASPSQKAPPEKPTSTKPPRKTAAERKAATSVVYIARGGTPRGVSDYEVAFPTKQQALAFVANQHGLTYEEQRKLAKSASLRLNRRYHGSDACAVKEVRMTPEEAALALAGEMSQAA